MQQARRHRAGADARLVPPEQRTVRHQATLPTSAGVRGNAAGFLLVRASLVAGASSVSGAAQLSPRRGTRRGETGEE